MYVGVPVIISSPLLWTLANCFLPFLVPAQMILDEHPSQMFDVSIYVEHPEQDLSPSVITFCPFELLVSATFTLF